MDSVPMSHQNRDGVGGGGEPNTAEVWRGNLRYRHNNGQSANFLFADGHVESLSISRDFSSNQLKWRNVRAN
jgi:prepilin-type processing-associated H-X9-DG protein